ncbi:MAG: c-type cytochrome [Syntrophobacteraceae bacterium]
MFKKALACGAIVCFLGCWTAPGMAKAADAAKGKAIYTSKCILCHGAQGKGNGPAGMAFSPKPANFTSKAFWQTPKIEDTLADSIKNGKGQMPSFPALSASDIQDVIQYIEQTFKPK